MVDFVISICIEKGTPRHQKYVRRFPEFAEDFPPEFQIRENGSEFIESAKTCPSMSLEAVEACPVFIYSAGT